MESNRWTKRPAILLVAGCTLGGFLLGSSSSEEVKTDRPETGIGRYQFVETSSIRLIFDTKTAERWEYRFDQVGWEKVAPPWSVEK